MEIEVEVECPHCGKCFIETVEFEADDVVH
jgi:hypothetical protein